MIGDFKIKTEQVDGVAVLRLAGRLNHEAVLVLEKTARELLDAGCDRMVLNMIDVKDLGSSGLGKLLQLKKTLELKRGTLVLSDLSPVVEYTMDLAGLQDAFYTYPNDEKALEAVSPRRPGT